MKTVNVLKTTNNIALFMAAMIFASCGALNKDAVDRNSAQIRKLTASDGQGDDRFGSSMAIYANTAIVGAVGDDIGSAAGQGSAYIFDRETETGLKWWQVNPIKRIENYLVAQSSIKYSMPEEYLILVFK
jgi:FG-GAP repeat